MINWWGFTLTRLKKRGLRHGSGKKRGVLGTGQDRKKGGLRHGSGQKRGVFTVAHTCTGHICECPPPPPPPGRHCNPCIYIKYCNIEYIS